MEWTQVFTIMATMVAAVFAFYEITKREIAVMREQMNMMSTHHREDMKMMDSKWERLFEKLVIQEQSKR